MTRLRGLVGTTAFKLSIVYLLASALFAVGLIWYVAWNAGRLIDSQIGRTLVAQIDALNDQYRIGGIRRLTTTIERRSREPGSYLYLLQDQSGETLATNISGVVAARFTGTKAVETNYQRIEEEGQMRAALVRTLSLPGGNILLVGRDLEERERINTVLNQAIRILLGGLLLFGGLGSFLVARRALARIDAMTATSQSIMAGDLTGRLQVSGNGDELDRLAISLNAMLGRIEELMQGMKQVSDNIAHDLKTPLTRLRNSSEAALRQGNDRGQYKAALERSLVESDHLIQTFNALLLIARTEAGAGADNFRPVELSRMLEDMIEIYEPSAEDIDGTLTASIEADLKVSGSRELLGQMVANLIDNALKYGVPDQEGASPQISVMAHRQEGQIIITVSDNGPGVPVEHHAKVLERFGRLDASRNKPGSGLGLSLVAAVVHLHKGHLRLEDNQPGLRIVVELPAMQALE